MSTQSEHERLVRLEEYRQLKAEMHEWGRARNQMLSLSLTVAAPLYGLGFQWKNPYVFLAALVIQLPTMAMIAATDRSVIVLGTYIQVAIESRLSGLNWETIVHRRATETRARWLDILTAGVVGLVAVPPVLSVVLATLFWTRSTRTPPSTLWSDAEAILLATTIVAVLVSCTLFVTSLFRHASLRAESVADWRRLVDELPQPSDDGA